MVTEARLLLSAACRDNEKRGEGRLQERRGGGRWEVGGGVIPFQQLMLVFFLHVQENEPNQLLKKQALAL